MRILPIAGSVLLALSVAIGGAAAATKPAAKKAAVAESAFTTANSLAGHGKYKEAVDKYKEALAKDPNNPAIHHYYGRTLALMGLIQDAIDEYNVALKFQKRPDAELENDIGVALATNDDKVEAAKHLHKATELNPKYIAAFNNLGVALMRLGDYMAARDAFLTSLKMQPTNPYIQKKLKDVSEKLADSKHFDYNAKPEATATKPAAEPEKPATADGAQKNPAETKAAAPATEPAKPEAAKPSTASGAAKPAAQAAAVAAPKPEQKKPAPPVARVESQPKAVEHPVAKKPVEQVPTEVKKSVEHVSTEAKKPVETAAPAKQTAPETTALTPKYSAPPVEAAPTSIAPPVSVSSDQTPAGNGAAPVAGVSTSLDGIGEITTRKVPINKSESAPKADASSTVAEPTSAGVTAPAERSSTKESAATATNAASESSTSNGSTSPTPTSTPAAESKEGAASDTKQVPATTSGNSMNQASGSAPNASATAPASTIEPQAPTKASDSTDSKGTAPVKNESDASDEEDSMMSGDKKAE